MATQPPLLVYEPKVNGVTELVFTELTDDGFTMVNDGHTEIELIFLGSEPATVTIRSVGNELDHDGDIIITYDGIEPKSWRSSRLPRRAFNNPTDFYRVHIDAVGCTDNQTYATATRQAVGHGS